MARLRRGSMKWIISLSMARLRRGSMKWIISLSMARLRRGKPKFVPEVAAVSFSGAEALAAGKRVFYVTHLGAFELTRAGLTLGCVFPGVNVQADILDATRCRIVLPPGGAAAVETLSGPIVSGESQVALRTLLEAQLRAPPAPQALWESLAVDAPLRP
eukprot:CAMPEP_0181193622 /NCGR_PEP_ID=MMETSP1096-20121128/13916_1 /TAXON_ID=156174 ORGANISM="Chrysochromulina ericina, Strain CCMP281" /NCGR_SAMPLE_ID=MMETSP1096 /ASSEMBLY_ACC=CAM_ASM_000453 /LENGTH=158 /DNA_ID=CAMNT_0023283099 /DNA_START=276 /DNA_END=752 /DNA_ORIENTATION=-